MIVSEAIQHSGTEVFDWLARDADVPVIDQQACQGDVSILRVTTKPATTPLPHAGVAVVQGENGGNTHSLHGVGCWDWAPVRDGSLVLGTLTVADGDTVLLGHPEHGFIQIAPGTYRVGRQREFAGEWRQVAD